MDNIHIKRFINIMNRKKSEGKTLDLYGELLRNFKKVDSKTFNYFISKLSPLFTENEINEMKSTFPKDTTPPIVKQEGKWRTLVNTYESMYEDDSHIKEFSEEQGVDHNQFRSYLKKYGTIKVNSLKKKLTHSEELEIKELLTDGFSAGKVAEMKGICYLVVNRIRKKYGIKPSTRWSNTPKVEIQKTEESSENKTWGDLPTVLGSEVHQGEFESTSTQNESDEMKSTELNISYVAGGKEAWDILNTKFDEVIPEDVYQNNQEFTAYIKKISEKYHTSATQTKKFIKSRMFDKEQGMMHHGYRDLDQLIDRYKLHILRKVSEIDALPTKDQVNELRDLKFDLQLMQEIKETIQKE